MTDVKANDRVVISKCHAVLDLFLPLEMILSRLKNRGGEGGGLPALQAPTNAMVLV